MTFLEDLKDELNYTETENGAVALNSTMNNCLDAFGSLGAMKDFNEQDIIRTFKNAFVEDRATAMKILFYMRDARGGQGMRRVFRVIALWLADNYPEYIVNNLTNFAEYGRWDDLLCLLNSREIYVKEQVLSLIKDQLFKDICEWYDNGSVSLLAKWLPSENASSSETKRYAKLIREYLGWSPKAYRKTLTKLRKYLDVVEVKMSANEWSTIHYDKVPGKASLNYSNAFASHDEERYIDYLTNADNLHAGTLFPVDIIHKALQKGVMSYSTALEKVSKKDRVLLEKMWESLPNYFEGKEETGICVCDTSGSMFGTPLEVSLSLGVYCADKCRGPFKNYFITFSEHPELVELKGSDLYEKLYNIRSINAANTDLEKVFDLLLSTAIRHNTPDADMPKKLYIISDMQFDEARGANNFYYRYHPENAPRQTFMFSMKKKYEDAGYTFPSIVYWNVRQSSNGGMFQEKFDGEDCAIVSGYSASLFKSVIEGTTHEGEVKDNGEVTVRERLDPMTVMMNTLNNPRYERVWVG